MKPSDSEFFSSSTPVVIAGFGNLGIHLRCLAPVTILIAPTPYPCFKS